MENFNLISFIFQSIMIFIIVGIIFYFIKVHRSYKYEKRITSFALNLEDEKELSLSDKIAIETYKIISFISKILNKSNILYKYSGNYDKYISYEERIAKDGADFVAIKFILAIVFSICSIGIFKFNIIFIIIFFIGGFCILDIPLLFIYKIKEKRIESDLLNAIIIMNNSFKAGASIIQAVDIVKEELEGPISDEFKKLASDLSFGLSIEDSFERFYVRIQLPEVKYLSTSLSLLNQTGGNIVKVFNAIEKSFYNRKRLKEEYESATAASNFVYKILLLLPFILVLLVTLLNNSYFNVLYTSPFGVIILILIFLTYGTYVLFINNLLKVKL